MSFFFYFYPALIFFKKVFYDYIVMYSCVVNAVLKIILFSVHSSSPPWSKPEFKIHMTLDSNDFSRNMRESHYYISTFSVNFNLLPQHI